MSELVDIDRGKKKSVVVTNVFGPVNRGDEELLAALLSEVDVDRCAITLIARDPDLCMSVFPETEAFDQFGKFTDPERIAPAVRVAIALLMVGGVKIRPLWKLLPESQAAGLRKLTEADLVVACPGGYFEDSSLSGYLAMVQTLVATLLGQRVLFAPQSIGPITRKLGKRILGYSLRRAETVYVRDEASYRLCDEIGVEAVRSVDLAISALALDEDVAASPSRAAIDRSEEDYAVVVPMRWAFPRDGRPRAEAVDDYVASLAALCREIEKRLNVRVVLMEQVGGDADTIARVATLGDWEVVSPTSPTEARALMESATACVSSRLHGGIFALQVGTPVVFLEYLPKTTGVLEYGAIESPVYPIGDFDPAEVAQSLVAETASSGALSRRAAGGVGDPFSAVWKDEVRYEPVGASTTMSWVSSPS